MLKYNDFLNVFIKYVYGREDLHAGGEIEKVPYGSEIIICPEPVTFLKQLDDYSNDQKACISEFRKILLKGKRIRVQEGAFPKSQRPCENEKLQKKPGVIWFNTTKNGINLRPGLTSEGIPRAVQMGDTAVHALMAGQTGSGKSAMLNTLICNLFAEYPPWELDLYLADFKKVEFSRYMNKFTSPHVCACAATGEIRYVVSMIRYLVDCMNARENLFARLGIQKISDLRDSSELKDFPPVVLPRMLLIVDEFQQMFLDANPKEAEQIRNMLTAIVKKGRATGFHILFASQELSNTLSRSDLANFKIRFALNCTPGVSGDVIGNREGSAIRKGSVIYNTADDGNPASNVKFTVPYIDTNVSGNEIYSEFESILAEQVKANNYFGFEKSHKFYQEDLQASFSLSDAIQYESPAVGEYDCLRVDSKTMTLEELLSNRNVQGCRREIFGAKKYSEIMTLGEYVTFSNLRYDIQTLYLEYGRNKNIMAVSPKAEDIAYMEKLFAYNFSTSPRKEATGCGYEHIIYSFSPSVFSLFSLEDASGTLCSGYNPDDLSVLEDFIMKRRLLLPLCRECETPYEFAMEIFRANLEANRREFSPSEIEEIEEETESSLKALFGDAPLESIPRLRKKICEGNDYGFIEKGVAETLLTFYEYKKNPCRVFPFTIIWIIGIDSMERIPEWFFTAMKGASDYEMLFITMASSEFADMVQVSKCSDYIFLGGTNANIYDRLHLSYSKKNPDSIALDLFIRSTQEGRSFKKYKCRSFDFKGSPSIPFDELLG